VYRLCHSSTPPTIISRIYTPPTPQNTAAEAIRQRLLLCLATEPVFPLDDTRTHKLLSGPPLNPADARLAAELRNVHTLCYIHARLSDVKHYAKLEEVALRFQAMAQHELDNPPTPLHGPRTPEQTRRLQAIIDHQIQTVQRHRDSLAKAKDDLETSTFYRHSKPLEALERPVSPVLPSDVLIRGFPELYFAEYQLLRVLREGIYPASVAVVALYRTLSEVFGAAKENLSPVSARTLLQFAMTDLASPTSAFIAAAAHAITVPWPTFCPADFDLASDHDLTRAPPSLPKIDLASDPAAPERLLALACHTSATLGGPPVLSLLITPDDRALVRSLWARLISTNSLATTRAEMALLLKHAPGDHDTLVDFLIALASPLRKISRFDANLKGKIYAALAHQAVQAVVPGEPWADA